MRYFAIIIVVVLLAPAMPFFISETANADFWQVGDVTGTEYWEPANGTYYVDSSFSVSGNLYIQSGTEVVLNESVEITVSGLLNAYNVTFRNNDSYGIWGGIRYDLGSFGIIDECKFLNASMPLRIVSDNIVVQNTLIDNSMDPGPAIFPMVKIVSSAPTFDNVTIRHFSTSTVGKPNVELWNTPFDFTMSRCNISGGDQAINASSNANAIVDRCIVNSTRSLWLNGNSHMTFLNSTNTNISANTATLDGTSFLSVVNSTTTSFTWEPRININDDYSDANVSWNVLISTTQGGATELAFADIEVEDKNGDPAFSTSTDASGKLHLVVKEFRKYNVLSTPVWTRYTPYDFTASKYLYHTNETNSIPITDYTTLNLELLPIDIDLSVSGYTPTFSGPGSTHKYMDEARMDATIGNAGVDGAIGPFAAPIFLYDNHTNANGSGYVNETLETDLIEVPGLSSNQTTTIMNDLDPGWHNVSIHIDPFGVVPDNNIGNNNLSSVIMFRVNVPPQLNMTPPTGDWNGTVNISGSAWDNRTDMDNLTNMSIQYNVDGAGYVLVINASNYNYTAVNQTFDWNFTYDTTGLPDGTHNMTLNISDEVHSTNYTLQFVTDNDQKPQLENVTVTPAYGNATSNYMITVNYTDDDGLAPGGGVGTPSLGNIMVNMTGPEGYNETINMTLDDPIPPFDYNIVELFTTGNFSLLVNGTYTFHVAAFDGAQWNDTQNYTINVNNSVPVVSAPYGASTNYAGDGDTITFYAWYSDADNEEPTISEATIDGTNWTMSWLVTPDNYTTGVNYSVNPLVTGYGIHYYNFTFSDGNNTYTTETLNFTISTPPVLTNGTAEHNGTAALATSEDWVFFNVTYSDINGDPASYAQVEVRGPGGVELPDSPYNMTMVGTADYLNGTNYTHTIQLSKGDYTYRFLFDDGFDPISIGPFPVTVENSIPTFSFVDVVAMGNAVYEINWTDHDIDDNATITFYYANNSAGNNNITIGTVMEDNTTDLFQWDASALAQGTYYLFATINDTDVNMSFSYSTEVFVNHNPSVQDVSPLTNDVANKEIVLTWTADDEDVGDNLTISLNYDTDNIVGGWTTIVTNINNTGTYTWNTTSIPDGYYYIAVVADDGSGAIYNTISHSIATVRVAHPSISLAVTIEPVGDDVYEGAYYNITGTALFTPSLYSKVINLDIVETNSTYTVTPDAIGDFILAQEAPDTMGNYTVRAWVEIDGDTWEATAILEVVKPPMADFGFFGAMLINPDDPLEGEEVSVQIMVRNTGSIAGTANLALYVDDATFGTDVDDSDVILAAGESKLKELFWTSSGQGTHDLILAIDPLNFVEEESEGNNNITDTVVVHVLADFSITGTDIVASNIAPTEGDNVSFTVRVHNDGGVTEDCEVLVYLDGSKVSPLYLDTISIEYGDYTEINVYWSSAERGGQIIRVELDPDNDIEEINENNNNDLITLDVEAGVQQDPEISTTMLLVIIMIIAGIAAVSFILWQRQGYVPPPNEKENL